MCAINASTVTTVGLRLDRGKNLLGLRGVGLATERLPSIKHRTYTLKGTQENLTTFWRGPGLALGAR